MSGQASTFPIRILDLRDSSWVDGPGRTVLETAEALDEDEFQVFVGGFYSEQSKLSEYLRDAQRRHLSICPVFEKGPLDFGVIRQILAAIDQNGIDLVHAHDFRSNVAGLFCAKKRRLPAVTTCHGWIVNDWKARVKRAIDFRILSGFDRVITVSESMKTGLTSRGLDAQKVAVVANALVVDDFQPNADDSSFRQELGLNKTTRLLVNIGRLSEEKGQSQLLDAIAETREHFADIFLAFVGAGSDEVLLREKVTALGLEDIVAFTGYRSDIPSVYNSADLVIQSSLTEGMPNVILESLLMETPVLATDVGGTREIVEHGVTGYLVPADSNRQLVAGIRDYLQNRARHLEFAKRGQSKVRSLFNHDRRVELLSDLYASVIAKGEI